MKTFITKYALVTLMLLIVALQFFMVYNHKLTRWKGGGFGMYSEVNYYFHEVWINTNTDNNAWLNADSAGIKDVKVREAIDHAKRLPNPEQLSKLKPALEKALNKSIVSIEVSKPLVEMETAVIKKKMIAKWPEP